MAFIPDKIFVVGSGGTGGHLIPSLTRLINYHSSFKDEVPDIYIIDGDEFEKKNESRQYVRECDIGKNKAEVMKEFCESFGFENVISHPKYIQQDDFMNLISESDSPLIISCVDNDATRKAMIDAVNSAFDDSSDYFFITPGNSSGLEDVKGQVLWYGYVDEQKYGIDPSILYENLMSPTDSIPVVGTCSANTPSRPQLIAANFMAASVTLTVIQNLLDNLLDHNKSSFFFDIRSFETTHS